MRLIDADVFKEIVGTETKLRRMVCDLIDSQPTAYDVDKVLEQLEENKDEAKFMWDEDDFYKGQAWAYQDAIDIVRNGGKE